MAKFHIVLSAALLVSSMLLNQAVVDAKFTDTTSFTWGADHATILGNGDDLQLTLDNSSGSGIVSKNAFLFGSIEMLIKLVPGNSAGTVTAYYLSSTGTKHDEIDFEFLGNVSGQPYTLHTNIYTQGKGNREQQFRFWFDPTINFHNYTIHWNPSAVVWYVDSIPIRVFRNYEAIGVPFPNKQGMRLYSSLWNAEDWATQGGRIKTDWTLAPFKANLRNFRPKGCLWYGATSIAKCTPTTATNWYTAPAYKQLSAPQVTQMNGIRGKFMIYDYCKDIPRFAGKMAPECSRPQF